MQAKRTRIVFADSLIFNIQQNSSVDLTSQKPAIVASYTNGTKSDSEPGDGATDGDRQHYFLLTWQYNPSFVLMQYFGYLGRDPEQGGYLFWLNVLNSQQQGNYRGMICAFITSAEFSTDLGLP